MATVYISLDEVIEIATSYCPDDDGTCEKAGTDLREMLDEIESVPPADVVLRSCYDRILAENDTMREQLAAIGKKPGDSMEDVEIVKTGEWIDTDNYFQRWKCSVCGNHTRDAEPPRCPNCGADMREVKSGEK